MPWPQELTYGIRDVERFKSSVMASDQSAAASAQRIALGVEYEGSGFHGWQRQAKPAVTTVQGELERALALVANEPIVVTCAGRTDAGVHAMQQIVHFDTAVQRPDRAWVRGVNSLLPPSIRVHWAIETEDDFHARFSALRRRYCYLIYNCPQRPAIFHRRLTFYRQVLDEKRMHRAAQCLLGEQDFSAFRAAGCQSNTPMRNVHRLEVSRHGHIVRVEITANAFLLHMVRNIVGALLEVGASRQTEGWIDDLLRGRDRCRAAATAPPDGLYLADVVYSARWQVPAAQEQWL